MEMEEGLTEANSCIDELYDQQEQLENHSRRNNIKIMGIPENENETWEESEQKAIEVIRTRLQIAEELRVERAHPSRETTPPLPPYWKGKIEEQAYHRKIPRVEDERKGCWHCQKDEARRIAVL